jgi:phosphoenolpyruvate-protein phosphotransferase/dihydroxyacetone kinase phosphotransfer subunit
MRPPESPYPGTPGGMVGIVVVSHSRQLAESAVELALQMVRGAPPPIAIAAGLDDGVLGTDAVRVRAAIDEVACARGVLVVMDLGSAVLSAELALDLDSGASETRVVLSAAPLVEGLVAAVVLAAAGADLDEVAADARQAGEIKATLLGSGSTPAGELAGGEVEPGAQTTPAASIELALRNQHGLHARPASRLVDTIRRFDAEVSLRNVTTGGPPVNGRSVSALSTLGALRGHHIEVAASGRHAREVLTAIAAIVGRNFDEDVRPAPPDIAPPPTPTSGPLSASPGIGVGPKLSLNTTALEIDDRPPGTPDVERDRLVVAITRTRTDLGDTRDHVAHAVGEHDAAIFDAHQLLLEDDDLAGAALRLIDQEGVSADRAWRRAVDALDGRFRALADPYLRARAQDVRSVGDQVLAHLLGIEFGGDVAKGVVVTTDLTPADVARLDPAHVDGIVTAYGSPVSHGAILARSLGIPAVVAAGEAVLTVPDGTVLVVDGSAGAVIVDPSPETLTDYLDRATAQRRQAEALIATAAGPASTTDGLVVDVTANVASVDDALAAAHNGADAVGLLRSEFLFLDRDHPPTEDEQVAAYLAVADAIGGRRLTVRTLDAGGDKPLPYLPSTIEANPFLGRRGIRLSLQQATLFKQQLRALVRTGLQHPVTVLFPMVATLDELHTARRLLAEAAAEVGGLPDGLPVGFEVGVMIEVPALALMARAVAPHVDLFSIGTNDLTQYTLAAERGNAAVAHLADPLHPAVLRLIAAVTEAAGSGVRVALCGEIGSEAAATPLLVGLGVHELSMSPPAIPAIKDAIRSFSATEARAVARRAIDQNTAAGVRALLSLHHPA